MNGSSQASQQHKVSIDHASSTPLSVVGGSEAESQATVIGSIRQAFITAPVGDMPTISKLMCQRGLLDENGRPTGTVTESDIREVMREENWKQRRVDWLYETCDLVPEEIQLRSFLWSVEIEKILFHTIQLQHRATARYFQSGKTACQRPADVTSPTCKICS